MTTVFVPTEEQLAQIKASSDPHRTYAAMCLGVTEDLVTHEQRQRAKVVLFGLLYSGEIKKEKL